MPYTYKKTNKGYTVYKKDTGKVVGHTTKTNLKKYLAALHMAAANEGLNVKLIESNKLKVKNFAKKLVENKKSLIENKKPLKEEKDYYLITSDINETWDDESVITKDIYNYLMSCEDSGGEELSKSTMNAIAKAINKFRQDQHSDNLKLMN